jgi:murein DD-endopeptidase MepM/ murein hydrolase activator NlpD
MEGPRTNSALQLAQSLRDVAPEANALMQGLDAKAADKARSQARKDALLANGAKLADAVREGKIKATQNPWYIQAYNREGAAISAENSLGKLQADSSSWAENSDPAKFAERWRKEVGSVGEGYEGTDQLEGFMAVEGRITSQVLQQNTAKASARIVAQRTTNLGALAASALRDARIAHGGKLTPNQAFEALAPVSQQWFATGGDEAEWSSRGGILDKAITSAAYDAGDASLLDLKHAPELLHGPSDAGNEAIGAGMGYTGPRTTVTQKEPGTDGVVPSPTTQVTAPRAALRPPLQGTFQVTSGFGQRSRPTAGASTNHGGIDYAAPAGTPVQAQATGKVVFAGKKGGYGNAVVVDYGNGVQATYGHLSSIDVQQGAVVASGQKVGGVGRTGVATGNHLHYRLEVNGHAVDPAKFNGSVGGTFEGGAVQETPARAGFPGQDQPFTATTGPEAEAAPANHYGKGPSLYDAPGVAEDTESDRYRISQAAEAKASGNFRQLTLARQARGYEAQDLLFQKHGTALLTGGVGRAQIIEELSSAGYSGPEIAQALGNVNNGLRDSVGVETARVAANQQNPGTAMAVLNLAQRAMTQGLSDGLVSEIGQGVMSGVLTGDDAKGLIGNAISTDNRIQGEARAETNAARAQARAEKASRSVKSFSDLKSTADAQAAFMVRQLWKLNRFPQLSNANGRDRATDTYSKQVSSAMMAWIGSHPDDWDGAVRAGQESAANIMRQTASSGAQK